MKWILTLAVGEDLKEYHLVKDNITFIQLKYNSLQQSVRIQSKGEFLSFFLERKGFIATKTLFKNGYGVDLGQCTFNRRHNAGYIEIENSIYRYTISGTYPAKVMLFLPGESQPFVSCEWPFHGKHPLIVFKQGKYEEYACLLLGLLCYVRLFVIRRAPERIEM